MSRPDSVVRRRRFWPPRDRQGVVIPHKMESIGVLKAVPHLMSFFPTVIPDEFWAEDTDPKSGASQIVISCPCGEEPTMTFGLRSYSFAVCGCDRHFMHDGEHVRVGKVPDDAPAADPSS